MFCPQPVIDNSYHSEFVHCRRQELLRTIIIYIYIYIYCTS
ncbi:hypothetical protein [Pantoea phage Nufs112]|nr:hypothetical protein [Pantoea phage Nufs112]